MSTPDWRAIAEDLNAHLAKRRLSSQELAAKAGVDRKTVDRLRSGRAVRLQTLQWIEQALDHPLTARLRQGDADTAPNDLGGYHRTAVAAYVGEYLSFRRSFDRPDTLVASHVSVSWDTKAPGLRFVEVQHNRGQSGRAYDYRFAGEVLIPPNLGVLHFVVRSGDGRIRVFSTSLPREQAGTLYCKGFLLTLNEITDIGFYPVTTPLFMVKLPPGTAREEIERGTGVIENGDERYGWADGILRDTERKFIPGRK